ncbi:hypothetical protein E2C01_075673 [Portunus trituberculatus]|uniref:Uncharacterized protein n=1 Tax=Portunus trituberculatus TaxID=210409 RepID=A0A5B7IFK7_PORTR|nr:hypothetical protein [Portunus trituberculatus]
MNDLKLDKFRLKKSTGKRWVRYEVLDEWTKHTVSSFKKRERHLAPFSSSPCSPSRKDFVRFLLWDVYISSLEVCAQVPPSVI